MWKFRCSWEPLSLNRAFPQRIQSLWEVLVMISVVFFRFYLFIFRERGREGEREKETSMLETSIGCFSYMIQLGVEPTTQASALTRNQTSDLLVYKRMMSSQLSLTGQGSVFLLTNPFVLHVCFSSILISRGTLKYF